MAGLWTLVLMYGYGTSSLGSLLCSPTCLPLRLGYAFTPRWRRRLTRASEFPAFSRCARGTANTSSVFLPPACSSSSYEGVGFAACSARLGLRQSVPSSWSSSCSSWFFVGAVCRLSVGWFGVRLVRGFVPRVSQWAAFLQLLPYLRSFSRSWIYEDFWVRRSLRTNPPR